MAVLAVLAAVLVAFALVQGDDEEGGGPLNAIAAAAERTQQQPGGRARMRAIVTSPERSFTMKGRIVYNGERESGVIEFPNPEEEGMVEMEIVMEGTMIYMRSDSFDSIPDGATWIGLDLALGSDFEMPAPASDVKGELEMLEAATGGVSEPGQEDVRGVPTTRYRATVGVDKQAEKLREQGGEELAELTEEEGTPLQIEVRIDAKDLVRRIRLVKTQPVTEGGGPTKTDMRVDFYDFGAVPEIEIPSSDEVFDMTSRAEEEIDE